MGKKSHRTGKHILHCLAVSCIVIIIGTVGCTPVQDKIAAIRAQQQLEEYREKLADGFFESIIQQGEEVVAVNDQKQPSDIALYALGEVYAHHAYSGKDYDISQKYFERLINNFPDSPLSVEAKTYISLFETIREKEVVAINKAQKSQQSNTRQKTDTHSKRSLSLVKFDGNKNFNKAAEHNEKILNEAGTQPPADAALYNLGLIYAHLDNPAKDYKKAKFYFQMLTNQFPGSDYVEEAKIWLGLFETIEKIQQINAEIEQQKKQMSR